MSRRSLRRVVAVPVVVAVVRWRLKRAQQGGNDATAAGEHEEEVREAGSEALSAPSRGSCPRFLQNECGQRSDRARLPRLAGVQPSGFVVNDSAAPEVVPIAGIGIGIRYADASLRRPFSETVGRFAVASGDIDVNISIEAMTLPVPSPGRLLFDSGAVWRAYDDAGGFRIDCFSELFGD